MPQNLYGNSWTLTSRISNLFFTLISYLYVSRLQLVVCVNTIIKHDFPGRWTQIVDKISIYLQNPEGEKIYGALLCLYQLVKNFVYVFFIYIWHCVDGMDLLLSSFCRYKKREDRIPLNEAMHLLLPLTYNLMLRLMPDHSEQSVLLQKQVLKVFYSLIQVSLSPSMSITRPSSVLLYLIVL